MKESQVKNDKVKIEKPTPEQVREWVERDLKTAHYFLGLLLRYPDVIKDAADAIYAHANKVENGSAIDHVKSSENGRDN